MWTPMIIIDPDPFFLNAPIDLTNWILIEVLGEKKKSFPREESWRKWTLFYIESLTLRQTPDRPFHNFGASKSVARRFWTTQSSLISWIWGSKIVKGPVRSGARVRESQLYKTGVRKLTALGAACHRVNGWSCHSWWRRAAVLRGGSR